MTDQTYFFQGTDPDGAVADPTSRPYGPPHIQDRYEKGREGRDAVLTKRALVPHSHGRAHTPALTPSYSLDQSGQGRPTVNLSGAPMTTNRHNDASPIALRLPVTGTATQRARCHAHSTKVEPIFLLGAQA